MPANIIWFEKDTDEGELRSLLDGWKETDKPTFMGSMHAVTGHASFSGGGTLTIKSLVQSAASIVLQTLVIPGAKTTDGVIIEAIAIAWKEIVKAVADDPNFMYQIPWRKLEELIAGAYKKEGYDVILTSASDDKGRDVIVFECDGMAIRVLEQVKAYKPGHKVKADEVRALLGVLAADQNASKGIVTTTSDFVLRFGMILQFHPSSHIDLS